MLLKQLFENYNLNLTSMLFRHQTELDLTFNELNIVNALVYFTRDKKVFYINSFAKSINAPRPFIEEELSSLAAKKLIKIESVSDPKLREVISFDGLFRKLTEIIESYSGELLESNLRNIYEYLEKNYMRTLTSLELVELKSLFFNKGLTLEKTKKIIENKSDLKTFSIFIFRDHFLSDQ